MIRAFIHRMLRRHSACLMASVRLRSTRAGVDEGELKSWRFMGKQENQCAREVKWCYQTIWRAHLGFVVLCL